MKRLRPFFILALFGGLFGAPLSGIDTPEEQWVGSRLYVRVADGVVRSVLEDYLVGVGEVEWQGVALTQWFRVKAISDRDQLVSDLKAQGFVATSMPYQLWDMQKVPNDTHYPSNLWRLHSTSSNQGLDDLDLDAQEAWDILTDATGIIVLVHDNGVIETHEDIAGNLWDNPNVGAYGCPNDIHGCWDPSHQGDESHGTPVAGVVGASGNNGVGTVGVFWTGEVAHYSCGFGAGIGCQAEAVDYAEAIGAKVFNASYGGFNSSCAGWESMIADFSGLFIAASGNNTGYDNDGDPTHCPSSATNNNLISVGGVNPQGGVYGDVGLISVDLHAPTNGCGHAPSNASNSSYGGFSGTSCSTPQVAGMVALRMAQCPNDSNDEVKQALLSSVVNATQDSRLSDLTGKSVTGGVANLNNFLSTPCFQGGGGGGGAPDPGLPIALLLAGPTTINAGDTVTLDGSGSSDDQQIVVYEWDLDDGQGFFPSTSQTIQVQYGLGCTAAQQDEKGNCRYNVKLRVTDNDLNQATDSAIIKVKNPLANEDPVPLMTISCFDEAQDNCSVATNTPKAINLFDEIPPDLTNDSATLTFDGGEPGSNSGSFDPDGIVVAWSWEFNDGTPTKTEPVVEHTFTSGGFFPVVLTVTDNDGDSASPLEPPVVFVPANPLPVLVEFPADSTASSYCSTVLQGDEWRRSRFLTNGIAWAGLAATPECVISTDNGNLSGSRTIRFDGSQSLDDDGNIVSFLWSFSDGTEGFLPVWNKTFTYCAPPSTPENCDISWDGNGAVDFDVVVYGADLPNQITFQSSLLIMDDNVDSTQSPAPLSNTLLSYVTVRAPAAGFSGLIQSSTGFNGANEVASPIPVGTPIAFRANYEAEVDGSEFADFSYTWNFGDGETFSGNGLPSYCSNISLLTESDCTGAGDIWTDAMHAYTSAGSFSPTLFLLNSEGSQVESDSFGIEVVSKVEKVGDTSSTLSASEGSEIVVLRFKVNEDAPSGFSLTVKEFKATGTDDLSRVVLVTVVRDVNGDGVANLGEDIVATSSDVPFANSSSFVLSIPAGASVFAGVEFLVVYKFG